MSDQTDEARVRLQRMSAFFHQVIEDWLEDPSITIVCGCWDDGAISEIIPAGGGARLLSARYEGPFAGVREIRLGDGAHHLHVDLGRMHRVRYAIVPSVCLGFRPALEVHFMTMDTDGVASGRSSMSLMPRLRHQGATVDDAAVRSFLTRMRQHGELAPDLVEFVVDAAVRSSEQGPGLLRLLMEAGLGSAPVGTRVGANEEANHADWDAAIAALAPRSAGDAALPLPDEELSAAIAEQPPATKSPDPIYLPLLREALALREASLVIYRERTLVEFQTEKIDGLHRYEAQGHVSWQIGSMCDHHCHLALDAVTKILFSAEPVSCQGGGFNYTVWFLTDEPCGNPWRPDGFFSVVLNRPYRGNAARPEVIEPVLDLYRRYRQHPWVSADEGFTAVLEHGMPGRKERPPTTTAAMRYSRPVGR